MPRCAWIMPAFLLASLTLSADLERKKRDLIAKGLQQKFITEKDIAALLPVDEMAPQELDDLYTSFLEQGIPVLDTEGEAGDEPAEDLAAVEELGIFKHNAADHQELLLRSFRLLSLAGHGRERRAG